MERLPAVTALTADEIAALLEVPAFRGRQIRAWVVERGATDFEAMTDLPVALRESLPGKLRIATSVIGEKHRGRDGTFKLLLTMEDGEPVECVLIPEGERLTLCASSQVGCPAGCAFCASGLRGLTRNLAAHEIHEQFIHAQRVAGEKPISNVVVMGMGEPLLNFENVVAALDLFPIGARRITLSTVGLPDRIRRLAEQSRKVNLAVSLHAPDDETRNRLVPINAKFGIEEVVSAARDYFEATGRDVTYEYILIEGVNASMEHADRLAKLLRGGNLNVNLIPMNPVDSLPFRPPTDAHVEFFREQLARAGIPTHVRRPRGREIDAACGQLRLRKLRERA
ncbi:MAG: 23S rRNA (adenine(2503)-C(2))-methyltransferase RlmN [Planctomycetota bacterium]